MKKIIPVIFGILLILPATTRALNVDVQEIKKAKKVEFINYTGKSIRNDPAREVISIGYQLADKIKKNQNAKYHMKYSIVRAISKDDPDKFSADIFSIDKDANVTHVRHVQNIIQGYLEKMYGYKANSARALAVFITYYNAFYRGNLEYLSTVYKPVVMNKINSDNAGMSVKYFEWPGKSKIVIPLTEKASKDSIDSIDPDIISDENIKKEIRKDDSAIKERKDLSEIKEKKIEKEKKEITEEKKEIAKKDEKIKEEKKAVIEEKKKVEDKKEAVKKKEEDIKKEKEEVKKITDPAEKKKKESEIAKKEEKTEQEKKEIKKETEAVKKKEDTVKKKEETVKKETDTVKKKEETVAKKEENLKEEKKEIKKDETAIAKKEKKDDPVTEKEKELNKKEEELALKEKELKEKDKDKKILGEKFYYMKINEWLKNGHYNNDMYMINASTRKIDFRSPVGNIGGNKYDVFSGGVIVITRKQAEYSNEYNLTLLDKDKLETKITGTDPVFYRSFVEIKENFIYAIVVDKGKYYLGRFDAALKLAARSAAEINENTFITFYEDYIYINSIDKQILVLKKDDLSQIDVIKP